MKVLVLIGSYFQNGNSEDGGSFLFNVWLIGMFVVINEMKMIKKKIIKGFESESCVRRKCFLFWRLGVIRWIIKILLIRVLIWFMVIRSVEI